MIQATQYNTDEQNLKEKNRAVKNKIPDVSGLATATVLNTKIGEVENKIINANGLVTTLVLNTKIGEVKNKVKN